MKYDHRFVLCASSPTMRSYRADGVTMRLDFCEKLLRVALEGTATGPTAWGRLTRNLLEKGDPKA